MNGVTPRRILIVSLDNLGDLAFAGGLVPSLRAAFPGTEIGVWAKEYASALIPFVPGVARVHASDPFWDGSPGRRPGTVARFSRALFDVRAAGYDAALIPNTRWRVALAARLAGVSRRIGFDQRGSRRWLTDALPPEDRGAPIVAEWARLLSPLGAEPARASLTLNVPPSLAAERAALGARWGAAPVAAIHPFAGDARRCAPVPFWIELLRRLRADGIGTAVLVGAPEESREFAAALASAGGLPGLVVAADLGKGSLSDALLAISLSAVFIGHDSGPLHCAAGLGIPALGLYLPGDWPRAMPQGRASWKALRRPSPAGADA
ncbi:MAG: glycosyltransferase family 9 protein, partial [Elusimicrobia bacterium]|nr:glycosyltransferase family 9 protein [Elusimicrobiota bacterium]